MKITYNWKRIKQQYSEVLQPLIKKIVKYGGLIDESAVPSPELMEQLLTVTSPLDMKYLGFETYHLAVEEATRILNAPSTKAGPYTRYFNNLVNTLKFQSTRNDIIYQRRILESPNPITRMKKYLTFMQQYELPLYSSGKVTKDVRSHIVNYFYKYCYKSRYSPVQWLENAAGYAEDRSYKFTSGELDVLAKIFVSYQQLLDIKQNQGSLRQFTVEETDIRARDSNSKPGFGYPIFASINNDELRSLSVELAKQYLENPFHYGLIPTIGQRRGQNGKTLIKDVLKEYYPDFDFELELPTEEMFSQAVELCRNKYGDDFILLTSIPQSGEFDKVIVLPDTMQERERLVDTKFYPKAILNYSRKRKKFFYKSIAFIPLITQIEAELEHPFENVKFRAVNKDRVVFAGANFQARADQTYIQPFMDYIKSIKYRKTNSPIISSLNDDAAKSATISNMFSYMNQFSEGISGDDKSAFDNYIHMMFTLLYPAMFIVPLFKDKVKCANYWKTSVISRYLSQLITYDGIYEFQDITDSGGTLTFAKGSFASYVGGLFAESMVTKKDPFSIVQQRALNGAVIQTAGDDALGPVDRSVLTEDELYISNSGSLSNNPTDENNYGGFD